MQCKCKYFLRDEDGILVCSVCGKPVPEKPEIEDKMQLGHETKKPELYVSDKDKAEEVKAQTEFLKTNQQG